jgi:hypothetical protein
MCYKKFDENGELNCGHCLHYHYEVGLEDNDETCDVHTDMVEREDCDCFIPELSPEEKEEDRKQLEKWKQEEARKNARIKRVLNLIKPLMGDRYFSVEEDLKDTNIWSASLTKVAPHESYLQEEDLQMYVEQHGSEDYGGYHGRIWYHLKDKHWLVMEYTC